MSDNKQQEQQVNFTVHNIYVKDISFEAPNSPHVFTLDWNPKLEFDVEMNRQSLEDDLHEVTVGLTVKVSIEPKTEEGAKEPTDESQVAFLVEVKQAGIFLLSGVQDESQVDFILSTTAPTILFPYVREAVSNLVTRGGFPQLVVPPMNFETMYQQHLEKQEQGAMTEAANA